MRVRIEHKFSHRYTELYVNGVREYVAEINPDVPIESLGYLCHRDNEKVWAESVVPIKFNRLYALELLESFESDLETLVQIFCKEAERFYKKRMESKE